MSCTTSHIVDCGKREPMISTNCKDTKKNTSFIFFTFRFMEFYPFSAKATVYITLYVGQEKI